MMPAARREPVLEVERTVEAPIHLEELLNRCLSRKDLMAKLLEKFKDSAREMAGRLSSSVGRADAAESTLHAHGIKGMAANVGAAGLKDIAARLEQAAKAGKMEAAPAMFRELEAELERCIVFARQATEAGAVTIQAPVAPGGETWKSGSC
jgi:HPt (histidine-containing phosphotransfer) domain-containing protein